MHPSILPTHFEDNPYEPAWFDRDFIHSPDGIAEFPEHHCKVTFEISRPFIKNFRTAVDVGCRDGEYTRYLQHYFDYTHAFDPRARMLFPFNVDLKKVSHYICALGDTTGEIPMYGGNHDADRGLDALMVPCRTLDSFRLEDVDYIKVDVEGFERKVLVGGVRTIERDRPLIVIEQNDARLAGEAPFAAKNWLEKRGYRHVATCPRGWDFVMAPD